MRLSSVSWKNCRVRSRIYHRRLVSLLGCRYWTALALPCFWCPTWAPSQQGSIPKVYFLFHTLVWREITEHGACVQIWEHLGVLGKQWVISVCAAIVPSNLGDKGIPLAGLGSRIRGPDNGPIVHPCAPVQTSGLTLSVKPVPSSTSHPRWAWGPEVCPVPAPSTEPSVQG